MNVSIRRKKGLSWRYSLAFYNALGLIPSTKNISNNRLKEQLHITGENIKSVNWTRKTAKDCPNTG